MRTKSVVIAVLACGVGVSQVWAQGEGRGTIGGRVLDPSGAVVPGADVRATNGATGTSVVAKANQGGIYSLTYLLPGTYTVTAEMTGFKKTDRPGIEVRVNDNINLDPTNNDFRLVELAPT